MVPFSFLTIKTPSQGIYKEKGSKFLAFAYPVATEDQVKTIIKSLRKEYFDARHHGYGYVLGAAKERFRAFDDGEPNHSTGDPILGQIRSKNLTNVLVVVVRYFGGVKLGVGGLIAAYKTAAEEALSNATIIEKDVTRRFTIYFEYEATSDLMRLIKEFDIEILEQVFAEKCQMVAEVKLTHQKRFSEKIELLKALNSKISMD